MFTPQKPSLGGTKGPSEKWNLSFCCVVWAILLAICLHVSLVFVMCSFLVIFCGETAEHLLKISLNFVRWLLVSQKLQLQSTSKHTFSRTVRKFHMQSPKPFCQLKVAALQLLAWQQNKTFLLCSPAKKKHITNKKQKHMAVGQNPVPLANGRSSTPKWSHRSCPMATCQEDPEQVPPEDGFWG